MPNQNTFVEIETERSNNNNNNNNRLFRKKVLHSSEYKHKHTMFHNIRPEFPKSISELIQGSFTLAASLELPSKFYMKMTHENFAIIIIMTSVLYSNGYQLRKKNHNQT